jgi:hypothetical protein
MPSAYGLAVARQAGCTTEAAGIGHKKARKGTKSDQDIRHEIFLHRENRGTEVDEQTGFHPAGTEITQQLGDVLISNCTDRLQFNNQLIFQEKIGGKIAEQRAILVVYTQGMLLLHFNALFVQPMRQGVLVDFLDMAMPVVAMDGETGFADCITEEVNMFKFHDGSFLWFIVPFCG